MSHEWLCNIGLVWDGTNVHIIRADGPFATEPLRVVPLPVYHVK